MKIKIASNTLRTALQVASKHQPSKYLLAIHALARLEAESDRLTITTVSQDIYYRTTVEATCDGNFTVYASAIMVQGIQLLPDSEVELTFEDESNLCTISYPNGNLTLPTGSYPDVEWDFPVEPLLQETDLITYTWPAERLATVSANAIRFVSSDKMRAQLNSVYFIFEKDYMDVFASNGHSMLRHRFLGNYRPVWFALSDEAAAYIAIASKQEGDAILRIGKTWVGFDFGSSRVYAKRSKLDRIPPYDRILPKAFAGEATFDRNELSSCCRRAVAFSFDMGVIQFTFKKGQLVIEAENDQTRNSSMEQMRCSYQGPSMQIGINWNQLMVILKTFTEDEVWMGMNSAQQVMIFRQAIRKEGDETTFGLMPILLVD